MSLLLSDLVCLFESKLETNIISPSSRVSAPARRMFIVIVFDPSATHSKLASVRWTKKERHKVVILELFRLLLRADTIAVRRERKGGVKR